MKSKQSAVNQKCNQRKVVSNIALFLVFKTLVCQITSPKKNNLALSSLQTYIPWDLPNARMTLPNSWDSMKPDLSASYCRNMLCQASRHRCSSMNSGHCMNPSGLR